jgi:hypothetical protein
VCSGLVWLQDNWTSSDMVDCILSYAASRLMQQVTSNTEEARAMLEVLKQDPRAAQQFLLLAHLYARTDTYSLNWLRAALVKSRWALCCAVLCCAVLC